jgi:L-threonylcarbamoyladenylate synthase
MKISERHKNKKSTRFIKVSKKNPTSSQISDAAELVRKGELVAFPTETVYGLGANGLNPSAIKKIFSAKNRPQDNPLILHVAYKKDILLYGRDISAKTKILTRAFWPGPLTIIVKKNKNIPEIVTGGLDTVGLRMPDNKIALALIKKAGVPIAAPSANVSGKPSPTTAMHVYSDMYGKIDLILDGGKTDVGLESTILDCSVEPPVLLRPGKITRKQIERLIGTVDIYLNNNEYIKPKSPGLKYRHYAPDAPLILVDGEPEIMEKTISMLIREYQGFTKRLGVLVFFAGHRYSVRKSDILVNLGLQSRNVSRKLFATLRYFDEQGVEVILAESYPSGEHAIMNRLRKAASEIIIAQQ